MLSVTLYNFSKRNNSTKRPTGGTTFNCVLKNNCSVLTPVIVIQTTTNLSNYNYGYIQTWSKYYFITDITINENNVWVVSMKNDALATYKTQIASYNGYIIRANGDSGSIYSDNAYPPKAEKTSQRVSIPDLDFTTVISNGSFVLGFLNTTPDMGAVDYKVMTNTQMQNFLVYLLGDNSPVLNMSDFEKNTMKSLVNPFQYIASCMWFPFTIDTNATTNIRVGWWITDGQGGDFNTKRKSFNFTVNIPQHPKAETRGKYLNYSPYSRYILDAGIFGSFEIDTTKLIDCTQLVFDIQVDLITGIASLLVRATDSGGILGTHNNYVLRTQAQIGVPIQLAQMANNPVAGATSVFGAIGSFVGSLVTGNAIGVINSMIGGVGNIIQSQYPTLSTSGGNGSTALFYMCSLWCEFYDIADSNPDIGKPYYKHSNITAEGLTGFVQFADGDFNTGTATEKAEINSYFTGGFFYE